MTNTMDFCVAEHRSEPAGVMRPAIPTFTAVSDDPLQITRGDIQPSAGTYRALNSESVGSQGSPLQIPQLRRLLDHLKGLWRAETSGTAMARCFVDAFEFAGALPLGIPSPTVWSDSECEVVFEWIGARDHAVVSLEGDGQLGYAMRIDGRFRPGREGSASATSFPNDLREYLNSFA